MLDDVVVDVRRLRLLLELSRRGSMREVADATGLSTSAVSQHLAALARESGTDLLEPVGRRVRLTPAGLRLADHAVTILAAVDAARLDLDPDAEPVGTVRVGGFATGVRRSLLPVVRELAATHPRVTVTVREHEPLEAHALLESDDLDLALTYDYDLAPAAVAPTLRLVPLWSTTWGLAVPADEPVDDAHDLRRWADRPWIVNSRNTADEDAVRILAATAGFSPRLTHFLDSLDLVEDLVEQGLGVGLLPVDRATRPGVRVLDLAGTGVVLTAYAATRRGRDAWPPLRLVLDRLRASGAA
ncbi:LysR family transcriptional regulator [Marmoricola sp. Leaf446]|uniref:LysR family transcriptional regulator n=1 Tax=Marmoricola sp. Leaf446 TaxID=1736379 RepID=UPI000AD66898|nr:LysR family transcriptional regulator [Marmoricola sp. Leaf446]